MEFGGYEKIVKELEKLLEEWKARSSFLSRIVKDELLSVTDNVARKLKEQDLYDAFKEIEHLGVVLESVHMHLQDLGPLYNKMWDLVKDKIK